jgi:hypothetical protein
MQTNIIDYNNIPANAKYIRCSGRVTDPNYITINSADIFKYLIKTNDETLVFINET